MFELRKYIFERFSDGLRTTRKIDDKRALPDAGCRSREHRPLRDGHAVCTDRFRNSRAKTVADGDSRFRCNIPDREAGSARRKTIAKWTFKPAMVDGKPQASRMQQEIEFAVN